PTRSIAHQIGSGFKAINHFINMLRLGLYPNTFRFDGLVKEVIDLRSYSPIIYIIVKLTIPAFEIAFPTIKDWLLDQLTFDLTGENISPVTLLIFVEANK